MAKWDFSTFVRTMYSRVVPAMGYDIVEDGTNMRAHFLRTGFVPVVEFEGQLPDVFDCLDTYYQLRAWIEYSSNALLDIYRSDLKVDPTWITVIDGLVNVQQEYVAKFRHLPVNLPKFITSFVKHGRASVLRADIY